MSPLLNLIKGEERVALSQSAAIKKEDDLTLTDVYQVLI